MRAEEQWRGSWESVRKVLRAAARRRDGATMDDTDVRRGGGGGLGDPPNPSISQGPEVQFGLRDLSHPSARPLRRPLRWVPASRWEAIFNFSLMEYWNLRSEFDGLVGLIKSWISLRFWCASRYQQNWVYLIIFGLESVRRGLVLFGLWGGAGLWRERIWRFTEGRVMLKFWLVGGSWRVISTSIILLV